MVSGYTLTIFPNTIHTTTAATKSKSKSNNKQQQPAVQVQMRNRDCELIGGEDLDNRFLSSHKRKTEEDKERETLQPSIHQKKDKLELCIISLILYLESNHKWTS